MYKALRAFRLQFSTSPFVKNLALRVAIIFSYQIVLITKFFIRIFLSWAAGFALEPKQFASRPVWHLTARFSPNFFYLIGGEKTFFFSIPRKNIYSFCYYYFIVATIIVVIIIIIITIIIIIIILFLSLMLISDNFTSQLMSSRQ